MTDQPDDRLRTRWTDMVGGGTAVLVERDLNGRWQPLAVHGHRDDAVECEHPRHRQAGSGTATDNNS